MNSHFQSSETTWTLSGLAVELIGLCGSRSCAPIQATPPTNSTVIAGIDQTSSSRRPEYSKSGRYTARVLDERNQKATPRVARIVGITIASMMPSELNRICRSPEAMGPFGSSTPSEQPPSAATPIKTTATTETARIEPLLSTVMRNDNRFNMAGNRCSTPYRISNLVCPEPDKKNCAWGVVFPSAPEIRLGEVNDLIAAAAHDRLHHIKREALRHIEGDRGWHGKLCSVHDGINESWAVVGERRGNASFDIGGVFQADAVDTHRFGHGREIWIVEFDAKFEEPG